MYQKYSYDDIWKLGPVCSEVAVLLGHSGTPCLISKEGLLLNTYIIAIPDLV